MTTDEISYFQLLELLYNTMLVSSSVPEHHLI